MTCEDAERKDLNPITTQFRSRKNQEVTASLPTARQ